MSAVMPTGRRGVAGIHQLDAPVRGRAARDGADAVIAVTRFQDLPAAFDALLVPAIGIVAVTFAWTVFMFVRGWWAETHPTRLARHDTVP